METGSRFEQGESTPRRLAEQRRNLDSQRVSEADYGANERDEKDGMGSPDSHEGSAALFYPVTIGNLSLRTSDDLAHLQLAFY